MQIHCCTVRYSVEEFAHHLCVHCSKLRYGEFSLKIQIWSAGEIYRPQSQCLVHWKDKVSIAFDACFISQCLSDSLSKYDSGIFDRMVGIYFGVSFYFYIQIKETMAGKAVKHMIKKRDSRINLILSLTIQIDRQFNVCLFCFSFTACDSVLHGSLLLFISSVSFYSNLTLIELACAVRCSACANFSISVCTFSSASFE